jgi:hypothetical protein
MFFIVCPSAKNFYKILPFEFELPYHIYAKLEKFMKFTPVLLATIFLTSLPLGPVHAELPLLSRQAETRTVQKNGVLSSGPDIVDKELLSFLRSRGITDISDFAKWLSENTSYIKDPVKDTWASPIETLKKQSGDCEDFAFLASRVAVLLGYDPHILILSNRESSHAVCVFEMDGSFVVFNNNRLQKTGARSLKELALALTTQTEYTICKQLPNESHPWQKKARVPPQGVLIAG